MLNIDDAGVTAAALKATALANYEVTRDASKLLRDNCVEGYTTTCTWASVGLIVGGVGSSAAFVVSAIPSGGTGLVGFLSAQGTMYAGLGTSAVIASNGVGGCHDDHRTRMIAASNTKKNLNAYADSLVPNAIQALEATEAALEAGLIECCPQQPA